MNDPTTLMTQQYVLPAGFSVDTCGLFRESAAKLFAGLRGKPAAFLEVGVFEGLAGCWLLENVLTHPDSCYLGVELEQPRQGKATANLDALLRKVDRPILCAEVLLGDSAKVLPELVAGCWGFEGIYIDGDHREREAALDITNGWRLLKPGGVMLVDDCGHQTFPVGRVLDEFLAGLPEGTWSIVQRSYQMGVRKEAP